MVHMTGTRPPHDLETKAAVLAPSPATTATPPDPATGVTAVDEEAGIVTAIAAVTGTVDDVSDVLVAGCFGRSLRERTPALCVAQDWGRIAGQVVSAVEYLPGDPRLPSTTAEGAPWPREAGALVIRARFLLGTREGREQYAIAQAFGRQQSFSIGYKVTPGGAKVRDGIRRIYDLDLYEVSPVLHGAHRLARQLDVKSAAVTRPSFRDRPGVPRVVTCSVCRRPAAALVGGGLRPGEALVCADCVGVMTAALDEHVATIDPADLDEAAELTTEQAYDAALDDEQVWAMQPDGSLVRAEEDPARTGRAWSRP
jgi:hypothetical protein